MAPSSARLAASEAKRRPYRPTVRLIHGHREARMLGVVRGLCACREYATLGSPCVERKQGTSQPARSAVVRAGVGP